MTCAQILVGVVKSVIWYLTLLEADSSEDPNPSKTKSVSFYQFYLYDIFSPPVCLCLSITLSLTFQGLWVDSWTPVTMLWTAMWMKEMGTKWPSSLTARSVNRWTKSPTRNCFTRFVIKTPQQGEWLWPVVK